MRFEFNGFEIEVKAKNTIRGQKRFNKDATMTFMNEVCIWMNESAQYTGFEHRNDGGYYDDKPDAIETGKAVMKNQQGEATRLYNQLKEYGCYDR